MRQRYYHERYKLFITLTARNRKFLAIDSLRVSLLPRAALIVTIFLVEFGVLFNSGSYDLYIKFFSMLF